LLVADPKDASKPIPHPGTLLV